MINFEQLMKECRLCPRNCGANRLDGITGRCGQSADLYAAKAAPHMWEEPCISGENGSGAVFFSGCPLGCVFCQNYSVSRGDIGKKISVERLAEIYMELQEKGVENINLVTPTHYAPHIVLSLETAKKRGLTVPIVYNTSGYEKTETLKMLDGLIDIYLPDFKYMSETVSKYCSAAEDYSVYAKDAVAEMVRQTGEPVFGKKGMMKKGVIVRHLLLPGCSEDSKRIIKYLYTTFGDSIFISIMNQFTPLEHFKESCQSLYRHVTDEEYDELVDYAVGLGVENGFIQEGGAADESFIPIFDCSGI